MVIWCDNAGLVSLIPLGWELRDLYHCTMCTRHPDLVSVDFYATYPYIPHPNLKKFYTYLSPLIFNHNS